MAKPTEIGAIAHSGVVVSLMHQPSDGGLTDYNSSECGGALVSSRLNLDWRISNASHATVR